MRQQVLTITFGGVLITGILLAASDGAMFPWPNLLGLLLTASAALMAPGLNNREEAAHKIQPTSHLRMVSSNVAFDLNFQESPNSSNKVSLHRLPQETAPDWFQSAGRRVS